MKLRNHGLFRCALHTGIFLLPFENLFSRRYRARLRDAPGGVDNICKGQSCFCVPFRHLAACKDHRQSSFFSHIIPRNRTASAGDSTASARPLSKGKLRMCSNVKRTCRIISCVQSFISSCINVVVSLQRKCLNIIAWAIFDICAASLAVFCDPFSKISIRVSPPGQVEDCRRRRSTRKARGFNLQISQYVFGPMMYERLCKRDLDSVMPQFHRLARVPWNEGIPKPPTQMIMAL